MSFRFFSFFITFLLFSLNAFCADIDIVSKRPLGQLNSTSYDGGISITFSRPVVALNSKNQQSSESCPIKITPPVKGTCRWIGTQTLNFTSEKPFADATKYTVSVPAGFKSEVDGSALSKNYEWTFNTARPYAGEIRPGNGRNWISLRPQIIVVFNMPVKEDKLNQFVALMQGDKNIPFKASMVDEKLLKQYQEDGGLYWFYKDTPRERVYVIELLSDLEKGKEYKLILKKDLPALYGDLGMAKDEISTFNTYGELALAAEPEPVCLPADFNLQFTNPVRADELAANITFDPPVSYTPCNPNSIGWQGRITGKNKKDIPVYTISLCGLDLKAGKSYKTTLKKDLTDVFGNKLGKDVSFIWSNKGYCPRVEFKEGFGVLESSLPARHPIESINAGEIAVEKKKIPYNDFITFFNERKKINWCKKNELKAPFLSNVLTPNLEPNISINTFVDLAPALDGGKYGIVFSQILNKYRYSYEDCWQSAIDNITNIGVNVKSSPEDILIWAADLKDGNAIKYADVEIRDDSNNILWHGFTDKNGIASAPGWRKLNFERKYSWSSPLMWIFVNKGADVAVVSTDFNDGIRPWRFNLRFDYDYKVEKYKAFTFTDRGVYRKGEPVYIKSIIRALKNGRFDYSGLKEVDLKISDARGKEVLNKKVSLADDSTLSYEYRLPSSATSGSWDVSIETDKFSSEVSFRVEAVKPAEFEVLLTPLAKQYFSNEKASFALSARYMFGGALDGAPVDLSYNLYSSSFSPEGWNEYSFYRDYDYNNKDLLSSKITLDEKGTKNFDVSIPEVKYPANLYVEAGVLSPQNMKLYARKSVTVLPSDIFIGIKKDDAINSVGKKIDFDIVAVNAEGKLAPSKEISVDITRNNYVSVRKVALGGRLEWVSENKIENCASKKINSGNGKTTYSFTPEKAGSYNMVLRAKDAEGRENYTEYSFYVADGDAYWKQTDDDLLPLELDKDEYRIGSTASLLIKSPYKTAQALITVEREGILDYYTETIKGGAAKVSIPVKESYAPNAFISVVLVHGRAAEQKFSKDGDDLSKPEAKFGYIALNVPPKEFEIKTHISAERADYRPGQTVNIKLRTEDYKGKGMPAAVTVYAVDEAMLSLTGYQTPDPFEYFYAKRPLSVETSDNRLYIIGQRNFGQKGENRGGDGGDSKLGGADIRSNFVFTPLFTAIAQTNESGNGVVSFKTPDNLSKFRLMAVAYSKDRFGKAQSNIEVSKPLMIKPLLPRFARAGDEFECGFILYNYTAADSLKTETDFKVSGAVKLLKAPAKNFVVKAGGNVKVAGKCAALAGSKAVFTFKAASSKDSDGLEVSLPIEQVSREEHAFTFSAVKEEENQKISRPEDSLEGAPNNFKLTLSPSLLTSAGGAAVYLKNYPYNCFEQQMSKLLLYTSGKNLLLALKMATEEEINKKITAILEPLAEYQTSSGGFAYWPYSVYPDVFVTAYGIDVLKSAESKGYKVDGALIEKAAEWLNNYLAKRTGKDKTYDESEADKASAYAVYALALAGKNAEGYFSNLYARRAALDLEGKIYLLKTAKLLNRADSYKTLYDEVMNSARVTERGLYFRAPERYSWIFTSDVKLTALALEALLSVSADFPQDYKAVAYLNDSIKKDGSWGNTLVNAAVIRAYDEYFKKEEAEEPNFRAFVKEDGKGLYETFFNERAKSAEYERSFKDFFKNSDDVLITVGKEGTGRLYYSLGLSYYPKDFKTPVSAGFEVEKTIKPVGGKTELNLGERAIVSIKIKTDEDRYFVALQDYLPAGVEIVNSALENQASEARDTENKNLYNPFSHKEIYDDSIAAFANYMPKGEYKFTYTVIATTSGDFKVPPAWVNAMYAPEVYGRTASSGFSVK